MKTAFLLFLISFPLLALDEKAPCRYDLVGPKTPPDSFFDKTLMTQKECRQKALKDLEANKEHYNKVIIKEIKTGKMSVHYLDGKVE